MATMVRDDDDQREDSPRERRTFNLLARLLVALSDEKARARQEEEENRNRFLIDCVVGEAARSSLGKRKTMERCDILQNPNRHDHASSSSSSSSLSSVDSELRLAVVPDEPIRAEPIRQRKPPVRREPVRRERGVTPEWLVNLMREENGVDAKLIIEKDLQASDVAKNLTRLLIPWNQMVEMDFLDEEERRIIDEHFNKRRETGLDVTLVDSSGGKWDLNLRRWDMKRNRNYVLVTGWTKVCLHNRLRINQKIHLWSFHSNGRLYFALVPPQPQAPVMAIQAQAADQDRVVAQLTDAASSSAMASAVTRDSEEVYVCEAASLEAEEESKRRFVNFPKRRRTGRVPVPATTRDSGDLGWMAAEIAPLEAVQGQEANRWTSPLSDLDLELRLLSL